jgi:hypothetical protein
MDAMVGKDFEAGLLSLQKLVDAEAKEIAKAKKEKADAEAAAQAKAAADAAAQAAEPAEASEATP